MSEQRGQVHIYTDGGADPNPGQGGGGAVLLHPGSGKVREISGGEDGTTNNRMELTAAIRALAALEERCEVKGFTDSQYLRKGITQWLPAWVRRGWKKAGGGEVLNADLWRQLSSEAERHEIHWSWVKGQAGNVHNERADALATAAIRGRKGVSKPEPEATVAADVEVFLKVRASPRGGAWAALVRRGEDEIYLGEQVAGATSNRLDILAALEALESLPEGVSVAVHTGSDYLRNGATQWLRGWKLRGWKTGSGDPVKNGAEWRRLEATLGRYEVSWPAIKGRKLLELKDLEARLRG